MKLSVGSQKLFYQNIRQARQPAKQPTQTYHHEHVYGNACRKRHLQSNPNQQTSLVVDKGPRYPKKHKRFLWKFLHGAYKIGEFWDKIPHLEQRGICDICSSPERMEHILLKRKLIPLRMIWKAAQDLWCKRKATWPEIHFSTILGCNLATFYNNNGKKMVGKSRLFKIIVLESAHLIWKLRNKALKMEMVLKTWSRVLLNEEYLPDNWVQKSGVLVGMAPCCPAEQNR
ncbi:hypothetical protein EV424DRAFT_1474235 [Suillus variegatus]|nr:hypothetical protein EV424DRAFT_1474235 [Suillus variegatus]